MTGPSYRQIRVVFTVLGASVLVAVAALVVGWLADGALRWAAVVAGLLGAGGIVWALRQR
jgi:hypothetical protein